MSVPALTSESFHALLHRRFACKKFDPSYHLSKALLTEVLEAARLAPSSYNTQPWEFLVLQGTLKNKLLPHVSYNAQMIQDASALVVVGYMHPSNLNAHYLADFCNPQYHERVVNGISTLFKERLKNDSVLIDAYLKEQCYIAVGQMCLAATLLGVDTCIIGGFDPQGVKQVLSAHLNPPKIACLIALGKGAMPVTRKARKAKESAIKWL
ncbi:NAD(P)H-dependent oxidoreductase [Helicobacter baculiformis]|uniref:NAD(P)H-dependent oxidoreductase n=1 Tax=Helicobacter baculiformis TaxID=427351 RepID=A0ABV7ZEQ0_9HELI|nr:NAD(P)H-dependent oxidoreductase [Helicobacter baculiformis]